VTAELLAWLATAAIHSSVLILAAWALGGILARFVGDRAALAVARERLWKLAIFGGVATATLAGALGRTWRIELRAPAAAPSPSAYALSPVPVLVAPALREARRPRAPIPWIEIAGGVWLAGVALGAAAWLRDRRRLARKLSGRERAISGAAFEHLGELRRVSGTRLGVRLSRAPGLTAPITRGLFRPEIVLPPRAERDLLDDELSAMLAHELAHARRRDPLLLALCRAVEVLFVLHPLVRFARARLAEEIEIVCDDSAARWTGDPASLASCLAEVATWIVAGSPEARAVAMAGGRSRLERRVFHLLDKRDRARAPGSRSILVPFAFALAASVLPLPGVAMGTAKAAEPNPVAEWIEMKLTLAELEEQYASLAAEPGLARAPRALRDRVAAIGNRLSLLRELAGEIEPLVAEELSAERKPER